MQTLTDAQVSPEIPINENFVSVNPSALFAIRQPATAGLVWGFYGGQFNGLTITDAIITLTASTTNYIYVARATGIVGTATTTTNWNNQRDYLRLYSVVTAAAAVTSYIDFRQAFGAAMLGAVNVHTKNQSVLPVALTSGAAIALDASLSNRFTLLLAINATLSNATGMTDGVEVTIRVKQDATGTRTLAYGTAYNWVGGVVPALSTAANAVDIIRMEYDATDALWACRMDKGYA